MAAYLLTSIRVQEVDGDGAPYPGALLYSYVSGTSTPQATYSDSDLTVANTNPVVADADGRFGAIYLLPTSYKFILADAADEIIYTQDAYGNPGELFAGNFGTAQTTGTFDVVSGYTVISTDRLVTVDSTGGADPCIVNLPAASTRTQPVAIKNMGTVVLAVTPNGSDHIDEVTTAYTLEAAASPEFPCVWLFPVSGGWYIIASHRAV